MSRWLILKDVLLTGMAIWIVVRQSLASSPNDALLVVALALVVPTVADHARALLSGPTAPQHSPSDSSPEQSPSGSSSSDGSPRP